MLHVLCSMSLHFLPSKYRMSAVVLANAPVFTALMLFGQWHFFDGFAVIVWLSNHTGALRLMYRKLGLVEYFTSHLHEINTLRHDSTEITRSCFPFSDILNVLKCLIKVKLDFQEPLPTTHKWLSTVQMTEKLILRIEKYLPSIFILIVWSPWPVLLFFSIPNFK